MVKVSIIVPVYGVEKYIERCAISLFEQTLDDIEYLFINDCTIDNSIHILKQVLDRYPNRKEQTKIINMPHNSGQAAVRKLGVELASGEYIIHCDSDDWVDVRAYEKLYNYAIKNESDIVFCDFYKSDGICNTWVSRSVDINSKNSVLKSVSKNASWSVWGAFVKRNLYINNKIIYPTNNNGEDFALMFQLIYYANRFSKLNEPLYFYYKNPLSMTNNPTEDGYLKRFNQLIANTELVIDFIDMNGKLSEYEDLMACYKLYCRTKISHLTKQHKFRELWESTYPELTFMKIITNNTIPLRTRLHYVAVKMNIYNLL